MIIVAMTDHNDDGTDIEIGVEVRTLVIKKS